MINKKCVICGKVFQATDGRKKFCSPECRKESIRQNSKRWKQTYKEKHGACYNSNPKTHRHNNNFTKGLFSPTSSQEELKQEDITEGSTKYQEMLKRVTKYTR